MRRHASRRDDNEKALVEEIERHFYVKRFDTPLDLHVCHRLNGLSFWVEVKEEKSAIHSGKRSHDERPALWNTYGPNAEKLRWLTPQQRDFVAEYPGAWVVVVSAQELYDFYNWLDTLPAF